MVVEHRAPEDVGMPAMTIYLVSATVRMRRHVHDTADFLDSFVEIILNLYGPGMKLVEQLSCSESDAMGGMGRRGENINIPAVHRLDPTKEAEMRVQSANPQTRCCDLESQKWTKASRNGEFLPFNILALSAIYKGAGPPFSCSALLLCVCLVSSSPVWVLRPPRMTPHLAPPTLSAL
jgi:hypothetical protein